MKTIKYISIIALLSAFAFSCQSPKSGKDYKLTNHQDSISYIIGYDYGEGIALKDLQISEDALVKGLLEGLTGKSSLPDSLITQLVVNFQQEIDAKEDSIIKLNIQNTKSLGDEYLAKNRSLEGVIELEDGLQYKIVKTGNGNPPVANDSVSIHFRAMFLDGTTFDMSYDTGPAGIKLDRMIKGLSEGIQIMNPGSIYEFVIPWYLAYGEEDFANIIPGGSTLRYHVELIQIHE